MVFVVLSLQPVNNTMDKRVIMYLIFSEVNTGMLQNVEHESYFYSIKIYGFAVKFGGFRKNRI